MRRIALSALALLAAWASAYGEDFNQWRGPQRNGLTTGGPALDVRWGKTGPAKLWESEAIPGTLSDGCGCVSVAGGKAYVYIQWKYSVDFAARTLTEANLRRLGWTDLKVPEDIFKAAEEARTSAELEKLKGVPRVEWIKKWAEEHITTAPDKKAIFNYAADRLNRGKNALPLDVLAKLETIKNKEFADQAALDKWFAENGVPDGQKAAVLAVIPTAHRKSWDTLLCLNAADGKTLWKKQLEGPAPYGYTYAYGASSTPTVVDGRCYFCGSKNDIYCLDATTGEKIWEFNSTVRGLVINHSSPLVTDGKVIAATGPLVALDAAKGTVLWKQPKVGTRENSPVVWRSGERTFLICNTGGAAATVHCVDIQDGSIVWSAPAGGRNTPAIVGDYMVTAVIIGKFLGDPTKYGLVAYKLSAEKAEKLWSTEKYSAGDETPIVYDGHVYAFAGRTAVCIELATGKVVWEEKTTHTGVRSGVLADGKIITLDGASVLVIRATPEKYDLLGKAKLPTPSYISPVVCDGRLYVRQEKSIGCYDLTRPAAITTPPPATPARPPAPAGP